MTETDPDIELIQKWLSHPGNPFMLWVTMADHKTTEEKVPLLLRRLVFAARQLGLRDGYLQGAELTGEDELRVLAEEIPTDMFDGVTIRFSPMGTEVFKEGYGDD